MLFAIPAFVFSFKQKLLFRRFQEVTLIIKVIKV